MAAGTVTITKWIGKDTDADIKSELETLYASTDDKWIPIYRADGVKFVHIAGA